MKHQILYRGQKSRHAALKTVKILPKKISAAPKRQSSAFQSLFISSGVAPIVETYKDLPRETFNDLVQAQIDVPQRSTAFVAKPSAKQMAAWRKQRRSTKEAEVFGQKQMLKHAREVGKEPKKRRKPKAQAKPKPQGTQPAKAVPKPKVAPRAPLPCPSAKKLKKS